MNLIQTVNTILPMIRAKPEQTYFTVISMITLMQDRNMKQEYQAMYMGGRMYFIFLTPFSFLMAKKSSHQTLWAKRLQNWIAKRVQILVACLKRCPTKRQAKLRSLTKTQKTHYYTGQRNKSELRFLVRVFKSSQKIS